MKGEQAIKGGVIRAAPGGPRVQKGLLLSIGVLVLTLMATSVWGGNTERYRVPQDMLLPFYAAGLGHTGLGADDWVIAAFYYPPEDIPADYDLFNQPVWDPPVGVETPNAEGFMVFKAGNPYPIQQQLHLVPGARMAVWFVPVQNFVNGVDGIPGMTWTVNSMKAEGAIVGWADFYTDSWEPGTNGEHHTIVVSGVMEDGRPFRIESTQRPFRIESTQYCRVQFGP
jgi:hypothetical protein